MQSSVSLWLPSSHCSPGSRMPLPHCSMWQLELHTWPPVTPSLPSHSSPGSLTPLPQCSNRQSAEQPLAIDGGSHCSGSVPLGLNAGLTMPSPHCGVVQSKLHAAVDTPIESHCSGLLALRLFLMPSPQNSFLQSCEQPSPSVLFLSSHSSLGPR